MAKTICWVEGERDADALWACGLPAPTCAGGVEAWRGHASDYIGQMIAAGCQELIVLYDHDVPGARLGRAVAREALENGLKVKLVSLGYEIRPHHGLDVSDFLAEDECRCQDAT